MALKSDHNKRNQGCQGLGPFQGQGPVTLMVWGQQAKMTTFPNLKKSFGSFQGQGLVTLMVQVNKQKWMTFPNLKSLCSLTSLSHLVYMCTTSPQKFHVGSILQVIICTKPSSSNYMFVVALQISFLHFQVNFYLLPLWSFAYRDGALIVDTCNIVVKTLVCSSLSYNLAIMIQTSKSEFAKV